MATDPSYPELSIADEEGWVLADESVETVFRLPAMTVRGATRQYEDATTRAALRDATDGRIDHKWRFVAATRLGFVPGLPPGTMPATILPTVGSEARRSFKDQLQDRGVEDIDRNRRERMRVKSGARARLTSYSGVARVDDTEVPVTGWVGVWYDRPDFFVVTGGYPAVRLADAFDIDGNDRPPLQRSATDARNDLLSAFRQVR